MEIVEEIATNTYLEKERDETKSIWTEYSSKINVTRIQEGDTADANVINRTV